MIYFHGVNEDNAMIVNEPLQISQHLGYSMLCVEYPGFGINWYKGICSERQTVRDSYSVLDWLLAKTTLKMKDICVFGRGMGTGVAAKLAYQMRYDPFYQVILVSAPVSIKEKVKSKWCGCCALFVRNYYQTGQYISEFQSPILLIHGQIDEEVPISHARALLDKCVIK